jgi:hypothetical protein
MYISSLWRYVVVLVALVNRSHVLWVYGTVCNCCLLPYEVYELGYAAISKFVLKLLIRR